MERGQSVSIFLNVPTIIIPSACRHFLQCAPMGSSTSIIHYSLFTKTAASELTTNSRHVEAVVACMYNEALPANHSENTGV